MTRQHWRWWLAGLASACAGAAGQWVGGSTGASIWPLTGTALALLLRLGPAAWPAVLGGALLGALIVPWPALSLALVLHAASVGCAWVGASWLLTSGFDPELPRRRDLLLLAGVGLLGAGGLSAATSAVGMTVTGRLPAVGLPITWVKCWLAEAIGLVGIGLPLLAARLSDLRRACIAGRWGLTLALSALACLAAGLVITQPGGGALGLAVLLPPVLAGLLALRAGTAVAAAAVLGGAAVGSWLMAPPAATIQGTLQGLPWPYLVAIVGLSVVLRVRADHHLGVQRRLHAALDGAGLGVAEWNLPGRTGHTSARWRELASDPSGDRSATFASWLQMVHPEDREDVQLSVQALSHPSRGSTVCQLRLHRPEGWAWFELHGIVAERDAEGLPLRLIATLDDVQQQRSVEEQQRLSSSLFRNLHEGLVIVDAELRVLDANPTYCSLMGLPLEDVVGKVPGLLRAATPEPAMRAQQAAMWAALRTQGSWTGEVVERRHNGDACALHVTVFTVPGPEGGTRYHVLMVSDITEQRLQRERLERQAHFDELTRLPNRARLTQLLSEAMASTDREGYLLAVCYLDVDHFKAVNDQFGHDAGDRLLVELAARLRGALRAHASWSDVAARLGGDEFVLLLRAGTLDEARLAVERVARVVAQPYLLVEGSAPVTVTASIGATIYPVDRSDADTLLRHADHAMYSAKQTGRNRHVVFDLEQSRRTEERVMAVGRVQEALDKRELVLHYQPKVDLRRGNVLGMEALLRWNHPEHGVVAPAQFLPLIEHTGLSARVGDWVLAQALDQLDEWQQAGLDLSVSVNLSARHLQEADFAQRLAELLARHSRPLGPRLELEILETAALADIAFTSALLERCAGLGVRFALDDFGTGYSTLTYLKRLPVQVLKIDRSFVHNMLDDAQDRAIVEGVVSLARTFDCVAVAEGVETPAQARLLLEMGCEIGQGAGIAAPMPATEVARFVREWQGMFAIQAA